jgi:tetratricopeptide (TPR) repeat protein
LRAKVGESLTTMDKYDKTIAEATTPSLEALKAYSSGVTTNGQKGPAAAVPLYTRAIELDPNFAMAHASLGNAYIDLREYAAAAGHFQKAYDLRDRVSEREKFAVTAYYFANVTGDFDQAQQTHELWTKDYPRSSTPHTNLGVIYSALGQHEKALAATLESVRLFPDSGVSSAFLTADYCRLNRLDEAKAAAQRILARNLDRPSLHFTLYGVAFLEGNAAEMDRQIAWAADKPGVAEYLLSYQSDSEAFAGHLARAQQLSRRAVEIARRAGGKEAAALAQMNAALRLAEFGDAAHAREHAASVLAIAPTTSVRILAALTLARAGDAGRAERMADELQKQNPVNAVINGYWLPAIRAAVELSRGSPAKAVEILQTAAGSELGVPAPQFELGATLYPVYLRGQAFLSLQQGKAAAAEFQKFADQRGLVANCPLGALAQLGLARALSLQGDAAGASHAYEQFLTLWTDADPDLVLLRQARSENLKLR